MAQQEGEAACCLTKTTRNPRPGATPRDLLPSQPSPQAELPSHHRSLAFERLSAELDNYANRQRRLRQRQQLSEFESESVSLPVASAKVGRKMLLLSLAAQTKRFQHLLDLIPCIRLTKVAKEERSDRGAGKQTCGPGNRRSFTLGFTTLTCNPLEVLRGHCDLVARTLLNMSQRFAQHRIYLISLNHFTLNFHVSTLFIHDSRSVFIHESPKTHS